MTSKPRRTSIIQTVLSPSTTFYIDVLELVLLCTVHEESSDSPSSTIYLADLATSRPTKWDTSRIDQALFERVRMSNPMNQIVSTKNKTSSISNDIITENRCLYYLSACYQRLSRERNQFKLIYDEIQKLFIEHTKTAINIPYIYEGQDLSKQWAELLLESRDNAILSEYMDNVNQDLLTSINDEINNFYENVFRYIYKLLQSLEYFDNQLLTIVERLNHLCQWSSIVKIIIRLSHPKTSSSRSRMPGSSGRSFQDTFIGSLLSKSYLPSVPGKSFFFFEKVKTMSDRDIEMTTTTMWQPMQIYQESLTELFRTFVKHGDIRNDVLKWIGDCLYENQDKNKDWSIYDSTASLLFVSDAFSMNLNIILLYLVKPFSDVYSAKLLKINPIYVITDNEHVHLKELYKEKPIINRKDEKYIEKNHELIFNFITESFFMTHEAYSCSVYRLRRILSKIADDMSRVRDAYRNSVDKNGINHKTSQDLSGSLGKYLTAFYNLKSALNEPRLLDLSNTFFTATCSWLVHLAVIQSKNEESISRIRKLPLLFEPNEQLSYIPELIVENIIGYWKFLLRYNPIYFETMGNSLDVYIDFVLVFMGDRTRLHNPYLRAALASLLEFLVPTNNNSFAERIFREHPLIDDLPRTLLDVFVSIELTGQAVAFEQKFSCRRSVYEILEYIWTIDKHRHEIKKLAKFAEEHIEDAEAPLFLRFINLLMNDANYLLDEAISHMGSLKIKQEAKERGEWDDLPEKQREELEKSYQTAGRTARYMNIMGIKTLIILEMITKDIQSIFCHPAISGRLSSMLNYFLQHLVGPKRRNLKVRNLKEYEFEPPKLVAKVIEIYLNFSQYDEFCKAVSADGMSYNEQLFPQAVEVLNRINYPTTRIEEFVKLTEHIKEIAAQSKTEEENYDDAPDEYLDPITDILMTDPVMLPSSRKIVDRTTISRHLLSDQTDPFNRNTLRMQDVIPQTDLKQQIEQWKASKHA